MCDARGLVRASVAELLKPSQMDRRIWRSAGAGGLAELSRRATCSQSSKCCQIGTVEHHFASAGAILLEMKSSDCLRHLATATDHPEEAHYWYRGQVSWLTTILECQTCFRSVMHVLSVASHRQILHQAIGNEASAKSARTRLRPDLGPTESLDNASCAANVVRPIALPRFNELEFNEQEYNGHGHVDIQSNGASERQLQ